MNLRSSAAIGLLVFSQGLVSTLAWAALHSTGTPAVALRATAGPGGHIKVNMTSSDLSVEEKDGKVTLTSRLDKLSDKDSELRAKHMREDFQADQYPTVTLVVNRADLRMPTAGQTSKGEAPGLMTLHGVTKPVRFGYAASEAGGTYRVTGSTTIDYTQFLGKKISRFGVGVDPPVVIEAAFNLTDS